MIIIYHLMLITKKNNKKKISFVYLFFFCLEQRTKFFSIIINHQNIDINIGVAWIACYFKVIKKKNSHHHHRHYYFGTWIHLHHNCSLWMDETRPQSIDNNFSFTFFCFALVVELFLFIIIIYWISSNYRTIIVFMMSNDQIKSKYKWINWSKKERRENFLILEKEKKLINSKNSDIFFLIIIISELTSKPKW